MKFFLVIDSLSGGGAERVLLNISKSLSCSGHDVVVVLTLGNRIAYEIPDHVRVVFLGDKAPKNNNKVLNVFFKHDFLLFCFFSKIFKKFYKFISDLTIASEKFAHFILEESPDCILSFLPNSNVISILAKKNHKISCPLILSDRNYLQKEITRLGYPLFYNTIFKKYYRNADLHISVSSLCKKYLNETFNIDVNKIVTINNGVDIEFVRNKAKSSFAYNNAKYVYDREMLKIVTAGRFSEQKDHSSLLQALAIVSKKISCCLFLIGEGELQEDLRLKARQLGVDGIVYFVGWQDNPYSIMSHCDVFVLSSLWEGFPNALLEAMAVGLPVISTRCPSGPEEILDYGKYGMLVPPGDPEAMALAVAQFADGNYRKKQAHLARRRVEFFSLERSMEKYVNTLLGIASHN